MSSTLDELRQAHVDALANREQVRRTAEALRTKADWMESVAQDEVISAWNAVKATVNTPPVSR
jgi:hypothetical protein